jgi:O-antigen/teichoic acid export membrane protein
MAKGAAWMIALRFAIRAIGLVSMIILARLLVPADFGLVAIAMALAGALAAMSEFGFQVALIQNQAADRRHYDTAWTLGIMRGLLVAGALAAAADRSPPRSPIDGWSRSSWCWRSASSSPPSRTLR